MKNLFVSGPLFLLLACGPQKENPEQSKLKEEVRQAEISFLQMTKDKGMATAFFEFADSTAVIKRLEDSLVIGKENIKLFYSNPKFKDAKVEWAPDVINVSGSGDMAYSYGKYKWEMKDSLGAMKVFNGVYQTVWKKQKDGSWKYVWD